MNRILLILTIIVVFSCKRHPPGSEPPIITVSISPFKYFVEEIAGNDFRVNVMVPAGANPHIYEPFPEQIINLRKSVAYISNGYLGFEMTWLDRFYETNQSMRKLSVGDKIDPIVTRHDHEGIHTEGADPHYWISPKCAIVIASSIKELLFQLNPPGKEKYESNYQSLLIEIMRLDSLAQKQFSNLKSRSFMIFHPNLGYLAKDYGLEEISVEFEGKEPPPSRIKELIDRARMDGLKTIFVQKEYDIKNAKAIANEINAEVVIIDPLSENWLKATTDIINSLHESLIRSSK
jgi:zinc transport system substrate-binding protein